MKKDKPEWYKREKRLSKEAKVIRDMCNNIIHTTFRMTDEQGDPFEGVFLEKKCRHIENEVNNILIALNHILQKPDPLVTPLFPPREE